MTAHDVANLNSASTLQGQTVKISKQDGVKINEAKVIAKDVEATNGVFWPFYGKYWILDLGPNYEYAVVGEPGRAYLWILSRAPQIDEALYQQLLAKMQARGFDTTRMIRTAHPAV